MLELQQQTRKKPGDALSFDTGGCRTRYVTELAFIALVCRYAGNVLANIRLQMKCVRLREVRVARVSMIRSMVRHNLHPGAIAFFVAVLVGCSGGGSEGQNVPSGGGTPNPPAKVPPAIGVSLFAGSVGGAGSADGLRARFNQPGGITIDSAGNGYVADTQNQTIRKVTPAGVTTLAGLAGSAGSTDGTGNAARFHLPAGVAVDRSGNVYVSDYANAIIRKITPVGVVTTLAGSSANGGITDGNGSQARFNNPTGLAVDRAGNVYVADTGNGQIRRVSPEGNVITIAGSAVSPRDSVDGTGAQARFRQPTGIVVAENGDIYVADRSSHNIRKIGSGNIVTTVAGSVAGAAGLGSADGVGVAARFNSPAAVAIDRNGNLIILDNGNGLLRRMTPEGLVTTISTNYRFSVQQLGGVVVDDAGTIYVSEPGRNIISAIAPSGTVTTVQGTLANSGAADGKGEAASFNNPTSIAVDAEGNAYLTDTGNKTVRRVSVSGEVTTVAGQSGTVGGGDGAGSVATFSTISSIARGPDGAFYVADTDNHLIRRLSTTGVVSTVAGQSWPDGVFVADTFISGHYVGRSTPTSVTIDASGTIFAVDGTQIRKVVPNRPDGVAEWVECAGGCFSVPAELPQPTPKAIVTDAVGNIYVAEQFAISKISAAGTAVAALTVIAGNRAASGFADGKGSAASFSFPSAITLDPAGNIYVADTGNNAVRKVTPDGVVSTVAGRSGITGTIPGGLSGSIISPSGIAVNGKGELLVTTENAVVKIQQ